MLSFFLNILKQKCGSYVCVQLLQTLNILFENIRNETSLCKYPLPVYDSFFFQYILSVDITINFHFIYQWSRGGKKAWFLVMGKKVQRLFFSTLRDLNSEFTVSSCFQITCSATTMLTPSLFTSLTSLMKKSWHTTFLSWRRCLSNWTLTQFTSFIMK